MLKKSTCSFSSRSSVLFLVCFLVRRLACSLEMLTRQRILLTKQYNKHDLAKFAVQLDKLSVTTRSLVLIVL